MNILVITDLYPAYPGQRANEISYAIHHFARQWIKTETVVVVRPNLFSGNLGQRQRLRQDEFELEGVRVINCRVPKVPRLRVFRLRGLLHTIERAIQPDVVVAHLGFNLLIGQKVATYFQKPLIAGVHNGDFRFGFRMLSEPVLQEIFRQSAGIACRSYPLRNRLLRWTPGLAEKCRVTYSGIEEKHLMAKEPALEKTREWVESKRVLFCSACSLIPRKHINVNLIALSRLSTKIDWQYRIYGEGREGPKLKRLADRLKISGRVRFMGEQPRDQVIAALGQTHVFLMVSANESFGLAYLEAMAAGNIVIAATGTGVDGIIRHEHNGMLCRPGDAEQLLAVLNKLILEMETDDIRDLLQNSLTTVRDLTEKKAARNYLDHIVRSIRQ